MSDEQLRWQLGAFGVLAIFAVALCFTSFGDFTAGVESAYGGYRVSVILAPVIVAALMLGTLPGMALGLICGLALFLRACSMPLDSYENFLLDPVTTVVPMVAAGLVAGLLFMALGRLRRRDSPVHGLVVTFIVALVASFVYSTTTYYCIALSDPGIGAGSPLQATLATAFRVDRVCEFLINGAIAWVFAAAVLIGYGRRREGRWSRSMRAVFQRWLVLFVALVFLCTVSAAFCWETQRAQTAATDTLDAEVVYIENQIDGHEAKTAQLQALESRAILDKATAASQLIARDPSLAATSASLQQLCDTLGLATIVVADGTGTVVADSMGTDVGTFSFASQETTAPYMGLISGERSSLVEDPRTSVNADGTTTSSVYVFAGVSRLDAPGFIQVSAGADDYQTVIDAVSMTDLGSGYHIGARGGLVVARDGAIVTATDPDLAGSPMADFLDADDSFYSSDTVGALYDDVTHGFVFVRGASHGTYRIIVYLPTDEVYASRASTMAWTTVFFSLLFTVVFLLASRLLDTVVIRGIVRTNGVLKRITDGDLEQRVEEHDNREFDSLSEGINTTVDALKESIAEAAARIDRELATAQAIQEAALPRTFPPFPDIDAFDLYASMDPAREVGGDFYDFFLIGTDRIGVLIADVSGKGIPAALFMMSAKTQMENYLQTDMDLADAMRMINHNLCQGNDMEMFVTAFVAVIDYRQGRMVYVNAGHNPPLLRHEGTWSWLRERSGIALGAIDGVGYRAHECALEPGDELFLYTDGVTEAVDGGMELFGEQRLEGFLGSHAGMHPCQLLAAVRDGLMDYAAGAEQADDITMLAFEYGRPPQYAESLTVPASVDRLAQVIGFVHGPLLARACPANIQHRIDIAVEELFVNVAHYAYPEAPEGHPGPVRVTYVLDARRPSITVSISDAGTPFDPLARPDPVLATNADEARIGGLGIFMTRKCVDDIRYASIDGRNVTTFRKDW